MANKNRAFLIKLGFKNIFRNGLMSFSSVSVLLTCLVLVGGALLMYFNIQTGIKYVGSLGEIVLYVEDGTAEYECLKIEKEIKSIDGVHDVEFISSSEGLEKLKSEIEGGDRLFAMFEGEEILPHCFIVRVDDSANYDRMVNVLSKVEGISETAANGTIAETLTKISHTVALFAAVIVTILMVVSVFILVNTLKLTMFSRRREIYIMKMVGSPNSFVRLPFFVESSTLGIIAALLSFVIIRIAYGALARYLAEIGVSAIPWSDLWLKVLLSFTAAGITVGFLSATVSIKKYLKV